MNSRPSQNVPAEIRGVISRLRSRIRAYVWLEGIAAAVIWFGLTFWAGLALDYLPVLVGATEMPRAARLTLLIFVSAVLLYIVYRWILRRAFARLGDKSLALLIERKFPEFQDSLVTTVEYGAMEHREETADAELVKRTRQSAIQSIGSVRLGQVFNFGPLFRSAVGATGVMLSVLLFAYFANDAFATWTSRFYMLSDDPWPRRAHIEIMDFDDSKIVKVAEGSDVVIRVRAEANRATPPPTVCTIYYRMDNGESGRANMRKEGEARGSYQHYSFDNTPFKGMLDGVSFDVVGFDHRVSDYRIEVVPSPAVVDVKLRSELPKYTGLVPRNDDWTVASRLPLGTKVTVEATANKRLERIELTAVADDNSNVETILPDADDPSKFSYAVEHLTSRIAKNIVLYDQDGIVSSRPFRLTIGAIEDQTPEVSASLLGIGEAVTPNARIPVKGIAEDDYRIDRTWFDLAITKSDDREGQTRLFPIDAGPDGTFDAILDLREERNRESSPFELTVGEEVLLTIRAEDQCDLRDTPNLGISEEYSLRVVEPSELLALLEANELRLRRRFEQIIAEVTETRDTLARVQAASEEVDAQRTGSGKTDDSQDSDPDQDKSLRTLRVQRARQQGEKAIQEVAGVTASFLAIRDELVNNRVDTEERKIRIEQQIVEPLKDIVDLQFPDWDVSLKDLISAIESDQPSAPKAAESVRMTDAILAAMDRVLQKMEELESYNELVDLVRSIIKEQEELLEKTKQERKNQAKSLLE